MKWYFCINQSGLNGLGEPMLAAVHSCLQNTSLEPHLIYDGERNELTAYLESLGVNVHFHKISFADQIQSAKVQPGYNPEVAEGAYLRYDIPLIDETDDVVLYTDVDVIFTKEPAFPAVPSLFAAAPEYATSVHPPKAVPTVFNSGVMLINLGNFRKELPALIDFTREHDFYFHGVAGFYDQGALNRYFEGRWEELPQEFNWRPFAGAPVRPTIVHFHGTKPYELEALVNGRETEREVATALFAKHKANYYTAYGLFGRFLTAEAQDALRSAAPNARISYSFVGGGPISQTGFFKFINEASYFYLGDDLLTPQRLAGKEYLFEYCQILEKYLSGQSAPRILEWGSGFTTLASVLTLDRLSTDYRIFTLDDNQWYQNDVARAVYAKDRIVFTYDQLTGPGRSQRDPELNYSTRPLESGQTFDFIFIDGRRRVECAYIASLVADENTIIVAHDFRRGRYQAMLGLYEVIEETSQFRVMRLTKQMNESLQPGRKAVRAALHEISEPTSIKS